MVPRKQALSKTLTVFWIVSLLVPSILSCLPTPSAYAAPLLHEQSSASSSGVSTAVSSTVALPLSDTLYDTPEPAPAASISDSVEQDVEVADANAEAMAAEVAATQALFAGAASSELSSEQRVAQLGNLPLTVERTATTTAEPLTVQFQGADPALAAQLSPTGIAFQLKSRTLAETGTTSAAAALDMQQPLTLTLDYSQLTFPFGGDFTHRLALYRFSGCAFRQFSEEPLQADSNGSSYAYTCKIIEQLPATNDVSNQRLSIALAPQTIGSGEEITTTQQISDTLVNISQAESDQLFLPFVSESTSKDVYYILASTASGGGGDYSATPFANVNDFQTDMFTGNFATSYPIPVPPSVAGPIPGVALQYSSGNVWGSADNTSGQAGQMGLGWELEVGSITRSLVKTPGGGSLGWYLAGTNVYYLNLNGIRTKLVSEGGSYIRLESDPSWKIERLISSDAEHPDTTKHYWLVTTPDGTKYRFGGEMVPADETTGGRSLNSVAYVYLLGYDIKAYKWYLDRVEDVHGNVITYSYDREYNYHKVPGSQDTRVEYVHAMHLRQILYTRRVGQVVQPTARITFNMEPRCTDPSSVNCAAATNLPDAPQDFRCSHFLSVPCVHTMPTFWSDLRLDNIQTQVYDQTMSRWRTVAVYDLNYTFPIPPTTGSPKKLWLKSIAAQPGGAYQRRVFDQIEAESFDVSSVTSGITYKSTGHYHDVGSGMFVQNASANTYVVYRGVDFGSGSHQVYIRHQVVYGGVQLELRLDSPTGTKIGELVENSPSIWRTEAVPLTGASGIHDLYVIIKQSAIRFNWMRFLPTTPLPAGLPAAEYTPTMLQGPVATADHLPVIGTVKTELGGTVNITYGQTHPCTANFTVVRTPFDCFRDAWDSQHRTWKVTHLTKSDPLDINASETYTYTYSTPTWHYYLYPVISEINNPCTCAKRRWNDFRGHAVVTETNAQGHKTEYRYYQGMDGDRLDINGGTYNAQITLSDGSTRQDSNWLRGKLAEMRQFDANGNVLVRNVYWYTSTLTIGSGDTGAYQVALQAQEQTIYGPTPKTIRVEYDYDTHGNVLRQRQFGDVSTPDDDRTVELSYVYNTTAYILNTPQWEKLWAGLTPGSPGQEQSYTAYAYDNQAIGASPIKGNLTLVRRYWQTTPSEAYADTVTTYDDRGRVLSVTDANNHTTTTDYHLFYGYPMTLTNELNFVTVSEQDPGLGVVTKLTDANGKVTEVEYDAYGRLIKVWLPTEPRSGPASLEYQYAPEARPAYIKTRQLTDASTPTYLESWEFADGFGRSIQTQRPSINSGQRVVTSQQYNNGGQLVQSSNAYEASGVAGSNYLTPTWSGLDGVTRLTYDALGRQTQNELLNSGSVIQSTQTSYQVWTQQNVDANGHRRDYEYDSSGQLARVREYNIVAGNPVTYTTQYAYNFLGNLTQVTDHANNVTSISYDLLGRKRSMDDPDMGAWQYQYDAVGNLIAQQDGRGLWLHLDYDELNRLTSKRRDSTSGPLASEYSYDVTDLGQLYSTKAYASNGISVTVETQVPERDDRYRATQNRWIVAGQGTFRMATSYDAADRVTQLQYPGDNNDGLGEIVQHSYNGVGQLDQVMSLMDGTPFINATTYLANGQIASQRFDQSSYGLQREYTYEAGTLRLQTQKASSAILPGSNNLQELTYTYDDAGNITRILDDANSGQQQCFGYDQLDQLTRAFTGDSACTSYSAGGIGAYDHTYAYDAIGNVAHFAGENFAYTGAQPHAVTAAFSNTYGYDDNGNQVTRVISGTTYTLEYDYENRLTAVMEGIAIVGEFVYDVDGQRVVGTVDGETVVYIAGVYEYHENGATISYYDGSAGSVAMRRVGHADGNGIFYIVGDHLGSASVIVKQDGTPSSYQYYSPFGGNRGDLLSPLTTKRYTGQYHEAGLPGGEGLSYYKARWYDAQVGRFVSADNVVPQPDNPRAYNLYSYVLNNPFRYSDPTGHIPLDLVPTLTGGEGSDLGYAPPTSNQATRTATALTKAFSSATKTAEPDFYISGVSATFGPFHAGIETTYDWGTLEVSDYVTYGTNGGGSLGVSLGAYEGVGYRRGYKGQPNPLGYVGDSLSASWSGSKGAFSPSISLAGGAIKALGTRGSYSLEPNGVVTVTFQGSLGIDITDVARSIRQIGDWSKFGRADFALTTYKLIGYSRFNTVEAFGRYVGTQANLGIVQKAYIVYNAYRSHPDKLPWWSRKK